MSGSGRVVSPWEGAVPALVCGSLILLLSLGIRHGFGLFLKPVSADLGWGRETFAFAIALQNLVWGISQPVTGLLADRFGAPKLVALGAGLYAAGLVVMATAADPSIFVLGTGVLIGLGLSGTTFPVIFGRSAGWWPRSGARWRWGSRWRWGPSGSSSFCRPASV